MHKPMFLADDDWAEVVPLRERAGKAKLQTAGIPKSPSCVGVPRERGENSRKTKFWSLLAVDRRLPGSAKSRATLKKEIPWE